VGAPDKPAPRVGRGTRAQAQPQPADHLDLEVEPE
jgi:hypothetical protein